VSVVMRTSSPTPRRQRWLTWEEAASLASKAEAAWKEAAAQIGFDDLMGGGIARAREATS
jgi:hypothetical protein